MIKILCDLCGREEKGDEPFQRFELREGDAIHAIKAWDVCHTCSRQLPDKLSQIEDRLKKEMGNG